MLAGAWGSSGSPWFPFSSSGASRGSLPPRGPRLVESGAEGSFRPRAAASDLRRKGEFLDGRPPRTDLRALHGVLQLPHVAGPGVLQQRLHRQGGKGPCAVGRTPSRPVEEVVREGGDGLLAA